MNQYLVVHLLELRGLSRRVPPLSSKERNVSFSAGSIICQGGEGENRGGGKEGRGVPISAREGRGGRKGGFHYPLVRGEGDFTTCETGEGKGEGGSHYLPRRGWRGKDPAGTGNQVTRDSVVAQWYTGRPGDWRLTYTLLMRLSPTPEDEGTEKQELPTTLQ